MDRNGFIDWDVSSDAVLRHFRSCPSRGTRPVPSPLKRGKKRKACDCCARAKLSCDCELPCETCLVNGNFCTYGRAAENSVGSSTAQRVEQTRTTDYSESRTVSSTLSRVVSPGIETDVPSLMRQLNNKISIPFLLNYTDPETKTFPDTFGRSSLTDPDVEGTPPGIEDIFQGENFLSYWELYPLTPSLSNGECLSALIFCYGRH
jgi:hypothetical protein